MSVIKFGTSGWRGIISETFTFANVELAARAIAEHLNANPPPKAKKLLIVGHDTRFLSREFATRCAEVIASCGFEVLLTDRDAPTPVISHSIRLHKAAGGINITASHNPPQWNGLKFNEANGAPSSPETAKEIEKRALVAAKRFCGVQKTANMIRGFKTGNIKVFDPMPAYFAQIAKLVDFKALKRGRSRAVVDLMFGTGRGYLDALLADRAGWKVDALHGELNPLFGAGHPEPIRENMSELLARLKKSKPALGLGLDPDADRFAIVDRDGTFINANQVLALTLYHLVKNRRWTGAVVRTVATSHLVDAVASRFGVKVHETPVGFKYIGALMESEPIIVGGEESGGLSVKGHVPEKDGILACLLMAELVAYEGKSLGAILKEIQKGAGGIASDRINLRVTPERKEELLRRFANGLSQFGGQKVTGTITMDGYKFLLGNSGWVMFRASGTEPVFRCYLEARNAREYSSVRACRTRTGEDVKILQRISFLSQCLVVLSVACTQTTAVRRADVFTLADLKQPPLHLKVLHQTPITSLRDTKKVIAQGSPGQVVEVVGLTETQYSVKARTEKGHVAGWIAADALEAPPIELQEKLRQRRDLIERHEVAVGMTGAEVLTSLGKPDRTTRGRTKLGEEEQWFYVKYKYEPHYVQQQKEARQFNHALSYGRVPTGHRIITFQQGHVVEISDDEVVESTSRK